MANPTTYLFDQPAPSLVAAQGYVYKVHVDNLPPAVLTVAVSGASSPFAVSAPIVPAGIFTAGVHFARFTAEDVNGVSPFSAGCYVEMAFGPDAPLNPRVQ